MTLLMLHSFFFLPIAFLSPETNSGNKNSRPSHGLLPSLFFFVIVLGMALGDFLLLLLTERFPVCVRAHGGAVHHGSNRLRLLQTVPKPHHSRRNAAAPISRTAHVGPSRCGSRSLGRLMLGREKRFSFRFPA